MKREKKMKKFVTSNKNWTNHLMWISACKHYTMHIIKRLTIAFMNAKHEHGKINVGLFCGSVKTHFAIVRSLNGWIFASRFLVFSFPLLFFLLLFLFFPSFSMVNQTMNIQTHKSHLFDILQRLLSFYSIHFFRSATSIFLFLSYFFFIVRAQMVQTIENVSIFIIASILTFIYFDWLAKLMFYLFAFNIFNLYPNCFYFVEILFSTFFLFAGEYTINTCWPIGIYISNKGFNWSKWFTNIQIINGPIS